MSGNDNEALRQRILDIFARNHFGKDLGFRFTEISEGRISGEIDLLEKYTQQDGYAHGGVILAISDIVAGFAAYTLTPPDKRVVTAEIKVSRLRPGVGEQLMATGYVLKPGKRLNFCEAEVYCGNDHPKLIAKATTIMAITV